MIQDGRDRGPFAIELHRGNQRRRISMVSYRSVLGAAAALILATPAFAHPGHGAIHSFSAGLAHPISGADHLLTMVAVGLWAALAAPRLFWVAPGGFMSGMLLGGLAGMAGLVLPSVELIIACSVILFGVLALFNIKAPIAIAFGVAAFFGAAHGIAHGAELPAGGGTLQYAAGFLLATSALHTIGVSFGLLSQRFNVVRLGQAAGGAVAAAGVALLVL
ncbi:MAG: HupE/UreJ family protein [Rhodomicrobiaceae bacterium]